MAAEVKLTDVEKIMILARQSLDAKRTADTLVYLLKNRQPGNQGFEADCAVIETMSGKEIADALRAYHNDGPNWIRKRLQEENCFT